MDYAEYSARVVAVGFVTASKEAFADIFPRLATLEGGGSSDPALESRVEALEADEPVEDAALASLASEDTVLHVQIDGAVEVANQAQTEVDATEAAIIQLQNDLDSDEMRLATAEGKISALQALVAAIPPPVNVLTTLANATAVTVTKVGGQVGFFGKTPVSRQAALTPPVSGIATATLLSNHTTRINEIEARLKAYGLLP